MDGTVSILRMLTAANQDDATIDRGEKALAETDMTVAWLVLLGVMGALAALDLCFLAPNTADGSEALPGRKAFAHVSFWFSVGLVFNAGIFFMYGETVAIVWFNGYILEYLLSMDNVFFFHVVFTAYSTPSSQIYKALFLGILGAVVLRLMFYVVGAEFFRLAYLVQVFFGAVLIYSGFKTAWSDEDDDDPRENRCVKLITRCLPLSERYDPAGALFAREPRCVGPEVPAHVIGAANGVQLDGEAGESSASEAAPVVTSSDSSGETALRGTMLFLVVVVLGVVDLIFAVDSVTAKIAEYDGTFINFSSSAFAMLCLRSMYFVLTRLLKYFRLLKYGVAAILALIGFKLIIVALTEVDIDESYSLATICGVFAISIVLSLLCPEADEYKEQADEHADEGLDLDMYPLDLDMYPLGDDADLLAAEEFIESNSSVRRAGQVLDDEDLPTPNDFDDLDDEF